MNENQGASIVFFIIYIAIIAIYIISLWKVYVKAGKPGWAAIIPFYNIWILLQIVGKPGWWLILYFVPLVNLVISLIVAIELAKTFGRSTTFGIVWLWILSIIGYPMLAFGKDKYTANGAKPTPKQTTPPSQTPPPAAPTTPTTAEVQK